LGSGLHLAYQAIGDGPLDIVLVPGFVSHVERVWDEPRARAALMGLAQLGRLILFDRRGVGLPTVWAPRRQWRRQPRTL
jgi:pimeloyl-ACP methyl ester carboxylesterase